VVSWVAVGVSWVAVVVSWWPWVVSWVAVGGKFAESSWFDLFLLFSEIR